MKKFFWITNISKSMVSLTDLNFTVNPMTSVNLLDDKHHHLTEKQVLDSAASGSIFKKRNKIIVRKVPPGSVNKTYVPVQENAVFPTKQRSAVEIENIKYEELSISDDEFAKDNADTAAQDHLGKWNGK